MTAVATETIRGWQMVAPGAPLEEREYRSGELSPGEVRVAVRACGLCHTDLGFLEGRVKPAQELPLTLGHEVSGVVEGVGAGVALEPGTAVIVPAVLPCGDCALCRGGRENACQASVMPGNQVQGGFASHLTIPGRFLIPVARVPAGHELEDLAVIADAVSTPYQAVVRGGVGEGDLAVFVGVGGIGGFGVQVAAARGAQVVALDIDDRRLERMTAHGAGLVLNVRGRAPRDVRSALRAHAQAVGAPRAGWKIFETSGTAAGQELAFTLLNHTATLGVVGFTMDRISVRLSNLMAFDAMAFGTWGARPAVYPEVLELLAAGKLAIRPFVRRYPMSQLNEVVAEVESGRVLERPVLIPDF